MNRPTVWAWRCSQLFSWVIYCYVYSNGVFKVLALGHRKINQCCLLDREFTANVETLCDSSLEMHYEVTWAMTECQWKLKETLPWLTSQLCSGWILFPPRYRPAVTSLCSTVTTVLFSFTMETTTEYARYDAHMTYQPQLLAWAKVKSLQWTVLKVIQPLS